MDDVLCCPIVVFSSSAIARLDKAEVEKNRQISKEKDAMMNTYSFGQSLFFLQSSAAQNKKKKNHARIDFNQKYGVS